MKRLFLLILVAAALGLTTWGWRDRNLVQAIAEQQAGVKQAQAEAQADLRRWQARADEADGDCRVLADVLANLKTPSPAPPVVSPVKAATRATEAEVWQSYTELLQRDPETQMHHLDLERGYIRTTHGVLLHRLKLSPGQAAQFEEISSSVPSA